MPGPRALWPGLAAPGLLWLGLLFLVPFYAVLAVAMGTVDPIFRGPVPVWNPLEWNTDAFGFVFEELGRRDGIFQVVFLRTFAYVSVALALSLALAYPVAYYVARHGGRFKGLLLIGLVAPFWISYLMRMLAWVNLLQDDGYVNRVLTALRFLDAPANWLDGRASTVVLGLVYGYVPFLVLILYAGLDRIERDLLEAARDLGATPVQAFLRVTLPLSKPALLAGSILTALPMFGDYYTPDLLSGSPRTNMVGNQINLYIHGSQVTVGAALVVVLTGMLAIFVLLFLLAGRRAGGEAE